MPKPFKYKLIKYYKKLMVTTSFSLFNFSEHLQAKPLFLKFPLPF